MSRKDAWTAAQIAALFAEFDKIEPNELNEKLRPKARLGTFVEDATVAVFGSSEPKMVSRMRSRVARIKRDFLDYLLLLKEKERNPSVAGEEYSSKLALLYQRLPKSLIGLEVTFDVEDDLDDKEAKDEVKKPRSKALFRVDAAKDKDRSSPDTDVPIDTLTGTIRLENYGNGVTVEKMPTNADAESAKDKSIQISEKDILSGPKNQVSAEEARRREETEAAKLEQDREYSQGLRKELLETKSTLFSNEDSKESPEEPESLSEEPLPKEPESEKPLPKEPVSEEPMSKKAEKPEASKKAKKIDVKPAVELDEPRANPTVEPVPEVRPALSEQLSANAKLTAALKKLKRVPKRNRKYMPLDMSSDDSDLDISMRSEMYSLPTSTPKRLKRSGESIENDSPTKRQSSVSQRDDLTASIDSEPRERPSTRNQPSMVEAHKERARALNGVTWLTSDAEADSTVVPATDAEVAKPDAVKRKRGRPRKADVDVPAFFKRPETGDSDPKRDSTKNNVGDTNKKKPTKKQTSTESKTKTTNNTDVVKANTSTANGDASVSSNRLPEYFEGMQQFLASVERLYVLADGDEHMRRALADLVTATTKKIGYSMSGSV
ncbi:hypothetical protein CJU89_5617 [Yarrowia sp. B02]|nr:hypothetical protein CJU89_5617 [Yarrowia sp. B02]